MGGGRLQADADDHRGGARPVRQPLGLRHNAARGRRPQPGRDGRGRLEDYRPLKGRGAQVDLLCDGRARSRQDSRRPEHCKRAAERRRERARSVPVGERAARQGAAGGASARPRRRRNAPPREKGRGSPRGVRVHTEHTPLSRRVHGRRDPPREGGHIRRGAEGVGPRPPVVVACAQEADHGLWHVRARVLDRRHGPARGLGRDRVPRRRRPRDPRRRGRAARVVPGRPRQALWMGRLRVRRDHRQRVRPGRERGRAGRDGRRRVRARPAPAHVDPIVPQRARLEVRKGAARHRHRHGRCPAVKPRPVPHRTHARPWAGKAVAPRQGARERAVRDRRGGKVVPPPAARHLRQAYRRCHKVVPQRAR